MAGNEVHRFAIQPKSLLRDLAIQVVGDQRHWDPAKLVPLATREYRGRDLVYFGSGQDEDRVGRRLFKGLQQGIERRGGEHVHFVHDVDLVSPFIR